MGNWIAWFVRGRVEEGIEVDALNFMPHEEKIVLTFEEERKKIRRRKEAGR